MHPTPRRPNPLKNPVGSPWMAKLASCQSSALRTSCHLPMIYHRQILAITHTTFFSEQRNEGCQCSSNRDIRDGLTHTKKNIEIWIGAERSLCKVADWKKKETRGYTFNSFAAKFQADLKTERRRNMVKQLPCKSLRMESPIPWKMVVLFETRNHTTLPSQLYHPFLLFHQHFLHGKTFRLRSKISPQPVTKKQRSWRAPPAAQISKEKRTAEAPQRGDKRGLGGLHSEHTGRSAVRARAEGCSLRGSTRTL